MTVTDQERTLLLATVPPHLRLWLLLCSDLAIRSGTAAILAPRHYDARAGTLTFTTKCDERLTLPITEDVRELIAQCDETDTTSFVRQLWRRHQKTNQRPGPSDPFTVTALRRSFKRHCEAQGITRSLHPHDFRRTTAVAMLRHSGDVRDVQAILGHKNLASTFWYLDHDLRPVSRVTLESIKRPAWRKEQAS